MSGRKNPKLCKVRCCRRLKAKGRTICDHHIREDKKAKDPVQYCYGVLRRNSRRRGKEFTLTLEQFRQFCYEEDYIQNKGKTHSSYTIDRIDNSKGYTIDNIRVLTNSENSRKGAKVLHYDFVTGNAKVVTGGELKNISGPF